jgi:hypothetical protein
MCTLVRVKEQYQQPVHIEMIWPLATLLLEFSIPAFFQGHVHRSIFYHLRKELWESLDLFLKTQSYFYSIPKGSGSSMLRIGLLVLWTVHHLAFWMEHVSVLKWRGKESPMIER